MQEPTLEDIKPAALEGTLVTDEAKTPPEDEFSAYLHTYLFGPKDKVVHTEGEEGEKVGNIYVIAGMYCMFNDGENGDTTMYFVLPIEGVESGKQGKWVYQDTLMQGLEGWTVLPRC